MKQKTIRNLTIILGILSIILSIVFSYNTKSYEIYKETSNKNIKKTFKITSNTVSQQIEEYEGKLEGIAIKFELPSKSLKGQIKLEIKDSNNKVLSKGRIDLNDALTNEFNLIPLDNYVKLDKFKTYNISLKSNIKSSNGIKYYIADDKFDIGHKIDTVSYKGSLMMKIEISHFSIMYCLLYLIVFGIISYFIIYLLLIKNNK